MKKLLIHIDELKPIVSDLNNHKITQGKACELITVVAERNQYNLSDEIKAVRQSVQTKKYCKCPGFKERKGRYTQLRHFCAKCDLPYKEFLLAVACGILPNEPI